MWKWFLGLFLAVIVALGAGGYWLYSSGKFDELMKMVRPELKPTEVRLAKAAKGDLVRTVSAPGQVEPRTKVEISAQVSARIIALPFRDNDLVKKDDVVVRLDARDLQALVDSAKAQLKSEEARLEGARATFLNAQLELNRRKELAVTNDVAKADVEQAEADFLRAKSQLHMAEHSIEIAKADITRAEKNLDNAVIKAPFDGIITVLNAEVGETVVVGTLNNAGSVIMEIADLSTMILKARVDEANIAPVKSGQKARVYVNAYPDTPFTGDVEKVGLKRMVDRDGTAYFETEVLVHMPPGVMLRSGLTANADIEVETFRDVIRLPSQAVLDRTVEELPKRVTDGNTNIDLNKKFARVVYVMEDGKAQPVPVTTGASDLTHTVILTGLDEGRNVIVGPYKSLVGLKHDQLVVEQDAAKPAAAKEETKKTAGGAS